VKDKGLGIEFLSLICRRYSCGHLLQECVSMMIDGYYSTYPFDIPSSGEKDTIRKLLFHKNHLLLNDDKEWQ
jgi:hypothetical protein